MPWFLSTRPFPDVIQAATDATNTAAPKEENNVSFGHFNIFATTGIVITIIYYYLLYSSSPS